jgi:pimeloyl-ACP methyl ester carboxylesterase
VPFLLVQGLRTRYRESGAARPGPPLVFVHGAAGSSVTWLGLLRQLGRTRRCLALDLPGHGQSAMSQDGAAAVSIEAYRDFLGAFLTALALERAVLVGHSMGAAIAIEAALAWPARVAALGLVGTAARLPVSPAIFDAIDRHFGSFPELMAHAGFSPSTPREAALRLARLGVQAPQDVVRADFAACNLWDARERVAAIKAPAVVVVGEDDVLTPPKWGRWLAEHLPGATLVALPHAGHLMHLERAGEVERAIAAAAPA